jgi:hypothetical protein
LGGAVLELSFPALLEVYDELAAIIKKNANARADGEQVVSGE